MESTILVMLGLMGSWNVAVTIWVLKTVRAHNNNKKHNPHNPHPPCEEHGKTLIRLEGAIEKARTEVNKTLATLRHDLNETKQTVAILEHEAQKRS